MAILITEKVCGVSLTRIEQNNHNQKIINKIIPMLSNRSRVPSYRAVCQLLNENEFESSVGNSWTERSIYRMLQRKGYSGLWGLVKSLNIE
jgi:hypothetical protein